MMTWCDSKIERRLFIVFSLRSFEIAVLGKFDLFAVSGVISVNYFKYVFKRLVLYSLDFVFVLFLMHYSLNKIHFIPSHKTPLEIYWTKTLIHNKYIKQGKIKRLYKSFPSIVYKIGRSTSRKNKHHQTY